VLLSVSESKGIKSDLIPNIATGFCGGISRTNGLCGAISGAVLALNLFFGRDDALDEEKKETNYLKVQQFLNHFEEKFGSTNCQVLTGCDLSTEQGLEKFDDDNLDEQCRGYVEEATTFVIKLIEIPTNG
jgi:C_GCAxxG_C_C family probable redox protein